MASWVTYSEHGTETFFSGPAGIRSTFVRRSPREPEYWEDDTIKPPKPARTLGLQRFVESFVILAVALTGWWIGLSYGF